jgi:hypothetical protein
MPATGDIEFFGEFESEHNLGQKLYIGYGVSLERFGYQRDIMGNRRALYTSTAVADQLAALPDDHPFKKFQAEHGWGSTSPVAMSATRS